MCVCGAGRGVHIAGWTFRPQTIRLLSVLRSASVLNWVTQKPVFFPRQFDCDPETMMEQSVPHVPSEVNALQLVCSAEAAVSLRSLNGENETRGKYDVCFLAEPRERRANMHVSQKPQIKASSRF